MLRVAEPHHFNAIRIQLFTLMRIRIQLLVMGIYNFLSIHPAGLHFEPPSLHCERPRLYFEPLKIFNLDCNADPDPAIAPALSIMRIRIRIHSPD
jgi:hypothetical protein